MTQVKFINGAIFIAGEFKTAAFTVDTDSGYFIDNDDDARVVDLSGKFIIPGLINAHTHISDLTTSDNWQTLPMRRNWPFMQRNIYVNFYQMV